MSHKVVVSIVGTAGRKEDGAKLNRNVFENMKTKAEALILNKFKLRKQDVLLVSGGSAWADHIAVSLWLENMYTGSPEDMYSGLRIFLPCGYDNGNTGTQFQFRQHNKRDDPGTTLNRLHNQFNSAMGNGFDSLKDLLCTEALGAELCCSFSGFLNRNIQVAKCDYMIAFTWGDSYGQPKSGGTFHTWKNCKSQNKIHVPLNTLCDQVGPIITEPSPSGTLQLQNSSIGEKRKRNFEFN